MAEAGLIRFFMPVYNEKFKNNYPDPKHVSVSTAYDLDLADIVIELQGQGMEIRFWSPRQPASSLKRHTVRFSLREVDGLIAELFGAISQSPPARGTD
jgi:hypothetical protein